MLEPHIIFELSATGRATHTEQTRCDNLTMSELEGMT